MTTYALIDYAQTIALFFLDVTIKATLLLAVLA